MNTWIGSIVEFEEAAQIVIDEQDAEALCVEKTGKEHGLARWRTKDVLVQKGAASQRDLDEAMRAHAARAVGARAKAFVEPRPAFVPGQTKIPPSGKVVGAPEAQAMAQAAMDCWLTAGRFSDRFEMRLAARMGASRALAVNSGSSANLAALSALTSPKLGDRRLVQGDEVVTAAAGFPTTINPILQNGLVPVLVDSNMRDCNIDCDQVEAAIGPRTKAIMAAHTLGNPMDMRRLRSLADKHGLWLIEDCCDALGATYNGQMVGTFGDIGTMSFYPAHHITMGEGGAVFTDNDELKSIAESFRDWGRDCYCAPGKDNTCGQRFCCKLGTLPEGYDHKYTYSHLGYNLKITDMQAACGLAQLERAAGFVEARKANFNYLKDRLKSCEQFLILPEATPNSDPSWFGFPITLRPEANVKRVSLLTYLDEHKIGTRLLFAGNLTRQPYMIGRNYRVSGELTNTDRVMNDTLWIGVFPGLTTEMLDFSISKIEEFFGLGF